MIGMFNSVYTINFTKYIQLLILLVEIISTSFFLGPTTDSI